MEFKELGLKEDLIKALSELNYTSLTPIQEQAIPQILLGKDVLGLAQTGTGKTATFALPILNLILTNPNTVKARYPRAIILAPTRELVSQIGENISAYSKYTTIKSLILYGGDSSKERAEELENPIEIIVSTPVRLWDLIEQKQLFLDNVEFFVLDEADKVIQAGAKTYLKLIKRELPYKKQTMYFSATMLKDISDDLVNPAIIQISEEKVNTSLITQNVMYVKDENKRLLLVELLNKKEVKSSIIFVNTKATADMLVRFLREKQIIAFALHSNKSDVHREKVLDNITSKKLKFLIATDLASRGLDIPNLTHIINYDIPTNPEEYVHRIGRTARMNKTGIVFNLCAAQEKNALERIEKLTNNKMKMITHNYHCEKAKNAVGKDARPQTKPPRNAPRKKFMY
jgi:ATP-dependent RNA helicase RhlE